MSRTRLGAIKRSCRSCGAKNTKAICRVCRWRLPAWLDECVGKAIRNRFTSVEDIAAVEMAIACVEDDHEFYRRLDSLVGNETETKKSESPCPEKK